MSFKTFFHICFCFSGWKRFSFIDNLSSILFPAIKIFFKQFRSSFFSLYFLSTSHVMSLLLIYSVALLFNQDHFWHNNLVFLQYRTSWHSGQTDTVYKFLQILRSSIKKKYFTWASPTKVCDFCFLLYLLCLIFSKDNVAYLMLLILFTLQKIP